MRIMVMVPEHVEEHHIERCGHLGRNQVNNHKRLKRICLKPGFTNLVYAVYSVCLVCSV